MGLCNIKLFRRQRPKTALETAILSSDVKMIEDWARANPTSLSSGDVIVGKHGEPPVLLAVTQACSTDRDKEGTLVTVDTLLKLGFSPSAPSADGAGLTPAYVASRYGRADILRLLMTAGADASVPTRQGQTPIIMAAASGFVDCVRLLLESGVDPNTPTVGVNGTALHLTVQSGHPCALQVCQLLLKHGADVNRRNRVHRTPLHLASGTKRDVTGVLDFLLDNGGDLDARDDKGCTPLMHALVAGNVTKARHLVERGANVNVKDRSGKTARDLAEHASLNKDEIDRIFGGQ